MKRFIGYLVVVLIVVVIGYTVYMFFFNPNKRARSYGGTQTIQLDKGQRLINATWKDNDLWYSTAPMESDYTPHPTTFQEQSSLGILNGKVIFVESR